MEMVKEQKDKEFFSTQEVKGWQLQNEMLQDIVIASSAMCDKTLDNETKSQLSVWERYISENWFQILKGQLACNNSPQAIGI